MGTVKSRIAIERTIVSMIVSDAIERGCKIAIDNGDHPQVLVPLQDYEEIMREVMATDMEELHFFKEGERVGGVYLVYGNDGYDVVHDYIDNSMTRQILTRAEAYALAEYE